MKRVLVLAYHFPPEGGPAVQRVLKFVKYLPENGYQPVVLTAKHPLPVRDASLLAELPSGVRVHRIMDWAAWMPSFWRRAVGRRRFPDRHISWRKTAVRRAVRIVREEGIDLLFASSPPHSVQVIASEIADRTGIPWVADLRDEWSHDPVYCRGQEERHRETEIRTLAASRAVVTVTPGWKTNFSRTLGIRIPVHFIPNGYDPADFSGMRRRPPEHGRVLRLLYSGRISSKHSPKEFLDALRGEFHRHPEWRDRIEIRIMGSDGNRRALLGRRDLEDRVKFVPYRPHAECIRTLEEADVLLLLATSGMQSEALPGKLYEYMATGKPILAVLSGHGEIARMLQRYGNAYAGFLSSPGSVGRAIHRLMTDWRDGQPGKPVRWDAVRRYDRRRQTAELARVFDSVLKAGS